MRGKYADFPRQIPKRNYPKYAQMTYESTREVKTFTVLNTPVWIYALVVVTSALLVVTEHYTMELMFFMTGGG